MSFGAPNVEQGLWAVYCTVGPDGYVDFDGEYAVRPTAQEASRIAGRPDQLRDIAWLNFSFCVGDSESNEFYPVGTGESFIATSRRSIEQVVFKPVTEVIESGKLTKHTAKWLGYLVAGDHSQTPDRYDDLVALLQ